MLNFGFSHLVSTESAQSPHFVAVTQSPRLWEHSKSSQYALSPSWTYRMPQNFIQPGKSFVSQGQPSLRLLPWNNPVLVLIFSFCLQVLWFIPVPTSHWSLIKSPIRSTWISSRRSEIVSVGSSGQPPEPGSLHIMWTFKMVFITFVQLFCFDSLLICDTNVKYFNTPIFEGVQKIFSVSRRKI